MDDPLVGDPPIGDLVQAVLRTNRDHQNALRAHAERLETELQGLDRLLNAAEAGGEEEEPELDAGGFVVVPGSVKVAAPISQRDLLSPNSPFFKEAEKRIRYIDFTSLHPMKNKELEILAEAVKGEIYRIHAYDAQKRGLEPFSSLDEESRAKIEMNKEGLDWERIAEEVSAYSTVPRSARQCKIRWLGDQHPQINHDPWSQSELATLKTLITEYDDEQINWSEVARKLGTNRTPIDCMRHAFNRKSHTWTLESDASLLEAVEMYGTDNWNLVARRVSRDATATQCQHRFYRTLYPKLTRGHWSTEEDAQLRLAVAAYGNSWVEVASLVPGRNNEQCRDRWERLDPNLTKGRWTEEEDQRLLEAVSELGPKWKNVSERLDCGRTDSMCRSRYETLKKRQMPHKDT